jgi:hypothetical protein
MDDMLFGIAMCGTNKFMLPGGRQPTNEDFDKNPTLLPGGALKIFARDGNDILKNYTSDMAAEAGTQYHGYYSKKPR